MDPGIAFVCAEHGVHPARPQDPLTTLGHAARLFRQAVGITPAHYRQHSRHSRRIPA